MSYAEIVIFRGMFFDHKLFEQLVGGNYENNQHLIIDLRKILGKGSGLNYCRQLDDRYCSLDYVYFYLSSCCIYLDSKPDIMDKEDLLNLYNQEDDSPLLNKRSNIIAKISKYTKKSFEECEGVIQEKIEVRSLIYDLDQGPYSLDR